MVDEKKISDNFLSLLNTFQGKTQNKNEAKKNTEIEGSSSSKDESGGYNQRKSNNSNVKRGKELCRNTNSRIKRRPKDEENFSDPLYKALRNEGFQRGINDPGPSTSKVSDEFFSQLESFNTNLAGDDNIFSRDTDKSQQRDKNKEDDVSVHTNYNRYKMGNRNKRGHTPRNHNDRPKDRGSEQQTIRRNDDQNEESENKYKRTKRNDHYKINKPMGYKFLENLLDREVSFVVTTLASPRSGFEEMINDRPIRPDLLMLILKVLNKVNESEAEQLKLQILSTSFKPEFIEEIKSFSARIAIEDNSKRLDSMNLCFRNILNLLETVVNILPSIMNEKLKSTLNTLNLAMKNLKEVHSIEVNDRLFEQLKEITDQVNSYIEHKSKIEKEHRQFNKKEVLPPNSYRDIPLIPTVQDFLIDTPYLRQNIVRGSYSDVDHYLDIQFRLLREDFIAPLREGIYEYVHSLNSPHLKRRYTNVRIYHKVKFLNPYKSRDVFGFEIQFDCDNKLPRNINWEYNKRFMTGSMLLFTVDDFQSFYLGTVVERNVERLRKGWLCVAFVPGTEVPEYLFEPDVYFVMAESEVYYEAYKPVLSALQRMNEKNFPMKQYIVEVDTHCFPPVYLIDNSLYEISSFKVNLLDNNDWPTPEQLKLNPSQHKALKSALTNDFVVIQGPPGTGKTFLALKITEIFLKNKVSENTPIIVVCYTNHALDQFLEGILKYTKNLIRIGSQSQNEVLQEYNLEEIRKKMRATRSMNLSALYREAISEKMDLQEQLQMLKTKIEDLSVPKGIISFTTLKSVLNPRQYNDLVDQEIDWLFCYDSPDLWMMEEQSTNSPANDIPSTSVGAESVTGVPEETLAAQPELITGDQEMGVDFEEGFDEEENARRLADMIEDDFFEEDHTRVGNYIRSIIYSLNIEDLKAFIRQNENELRYIQNKENSSQEDYYMAMRLKNQIKDMRIQLDFLQNRLIMFFSVFRFSPEKLARFQNVSSVWEMNSKDRWEYYVTLIHLYICQLKQFLQYLTKRYQDCILKLYELRQLEDVKFVQAAKVVGLTTSGAAKRRVLLENLGTRIVIVEEAAEVLEAHIVTSLAQSVQQVILIGDHKQLKPNPSVYKLAKKFNLDVSLFERMIKNGLNCSVLDEQHRMRPEIASLITPTIYPSLANHSSTLDRQDVLGINKFVFFLTHNQPEDQMPDSASKQNKYEADFLIELCQYLLLQEYKPEEITILATYTGQVWYMRKRKKEMAQKNPDWKLIRITPVDNFQGEENRIILLSLVRSNAEARIGFLATENRVCVALSRAKEGLYIIGNMDNLTASSTIWPRIKQRLEEINAIGHELTLRCQRHPDQVTRVSKAEHFTKVPYGGCMLKCAAQLNCGHTCPKICHIIDRHHGFYKCKKKCDRPPCEVEGHKCPLLCWQTCNPCEIQMKKELPCGHTGMLRCHEEPAAYKCLELVSATLPACGHEVSKFCYLEVEKCRCTHPCPTRLPCGHACTRKCHVNDDPDHIEYKCMKECAREYKGCPRRKHPCPKRCYEICGDCIVPIHTKLPCGHFEEIACSVDPASVKCEKPCTKILSCNHKCKSPCWVTCDVKLCEKKVDKLAPCGHMMKNMRCNQPTESRKCFENCLRKLPCGHPCTDKCNNDCSKVICKQEVQSRVLPACGHPAMEIPCHLNKTELQSGSDELVQLCKQPCNAQLSCGHTCEGTCGRCMQGRLHVPCHKKCTNILICGHQCRAECSQLCPQCSETKCHTRCNHKRCDRKHPCNKSCDSCYKNCIWECEHFKCRKKCGEECDRQVCNEPCSLLLGCGHKCIGFCGEVCPSLCAICKRDDPAISDDPDDRYVHLEDCNHLVSGKKLDAQFNEAVNNNIYRPMMCPKCSVPIVKTMRYRNVYITFRKQVTNIFKLVFEERNRLKKILGRHAELMSNNPTLSPSMNVLLYQCSDLRNQGKGQPQQEMGRLAVGYVLQPLAMKCFEHPDVGVNQRLYFRLEYLAISILQRINHIGYQDILQIELEVARILRLLSPINTLSWYDVTPYSWLSDHQQLQLTPPVNEPFNRVSSTLRTLHITRQWYCCDQQHWYVSDNGEPCTTCTDEKEENLRRLEEQERNRANHGDNKGGQRKNKEISNRHHGPRSDGPNITNFVNVGRGRGNRGGFGEQGSRGRGYQGRGGGRGGYRGQGGRGRGNPAKGRGRYRDRW